MEESAQNGRHIMFTYSLSMSPSKKMSKMLHVTGMTYVRLNDEGKIEYHRDYWDFLGAMLSMFPRALRVYRRLVAKLGWRKQNIRNQAIPVLFPRQAPGLSFARISVISDSRSPCWWRTALLLTGLRISSLYPCCYLSLLICLTLYKAAFLICLWKIMLTSVRFGNGHRLFQYIFT